MKKRLLTMSLAVLMAVSFTACGSKTDLGTGNTKTATEAADTESAPDVEGDNDIDITYDSKDTEHSASTYKEDATIQDKIKQDLAESTTTVSFGSRVGMKKTFDYYHYFDMKLPSNIKCDHLSEADPNNSVDSTELSNIGTNVESGKDYGILSAYVKNQYSIYVDTYMNTEPYSAEYVGRQFDGQNVTVKSVDIDGHDGFIVFPASTERTIEHMELYLNIGNATYKDFVYYTGIHISLDGKMTDDNSESHYNELLDYITSLMTIDAKQVS